MQPLSRINSDNFDSFSEIRLWIILGIPYLRAILKNSKGNSYLRILESKRAEKTSCTIYLTSNSHSGRIDEKETAGKSNKIDSGAKRIQSLMIEYRANLLLCTFFSHFRLAILILLFTSDFRPCSMHRA